jgi:hypothetical protein
VSDIRRARGARMARRDGTGEILQSARKHLIIKEIQAAIARELAARSEVPKTMPQRIADLLRELHRRLRDPGPEVAPRFFRPAACWLRPPFPVTVRLTQGIMTPHPPPKMTPGANEPP